MQNIKVPPLSCTLLQLSKGEKNYQKVNKWKIKFKKQKKGKKKKKEMCLHSPKTWVRTEKILG